MAIKIIAAIGKNNELGKDNQLIWPISADLKFFKNQTMGYDIIMGRKTFETLPHLLEGRRHLVLSRKPLIIEGVIVCSNIDELLENYQGKDAFVIGGAGIYKEFLKYAKEMYLTQIDAECKEADAYFPVFDKEDYEIEILGEGHDKKINVSYKHVLYKRR